MLSSNILAASGLPMPYSGALVLRLASGMCIGILFEAGDTFAAQFRIKQQARCYPADSIEQHFANFNSSLLAELKQSRPNTDFVRLCAAATVDLARQRDGKASARCMVASTDHATVGPDKQIGSYDLYCHADPRQFLQEVLDSISDPVHWRRV